MARASVASSSGYVDVDVRRGGIFRASPVTVLQAGRDRRMSKSGLADGRGDGLGREGDRGCFGPWLSGGHGLPRDLAPLLGSAFFTSPLHDMIPFLRTSPRQAPVLSRRSLSTATAALLGRLSLPVSPQTPTAGVYNGKWINGGGPLITSTNPSTGEVLGTVSSASLADVENTVVAAREAYKLWRHVAPPKRGEVLRQMRFALAEKMDDLGDLVSLEMGKIRSEGKGQCSRAP